MASLYIHIPFCRHKCIYCDFYSVTHLDQIEQFISALFREIDLWATDPFFQQQTFSTLYFGGGTPSLLSAQQIASIINKVYSAFSFEADAEVSIEANPGALLQKNLAAYRAAGVNRLTLGVQSFHDDELKFLTRIHSASDAENAFHAARQAGFDNIGIDLIFGLPGQTLESWENNCRKAVELHPEHMSMYGLTYEENTLLWRQLEQQVFQRCEEETERAMFIHGIEILRDGGYEQYEISNFAVPGYASRHNQSYWDATAFLSLGPSAHSFDGQKRWWNVSDLQRYIDRLTLNILPIESEEILSPAEKNEEFVLLGLRRKTGVNILEWEKMIRQERSTILATLVDMFGDIDSITGFEFSNQGALLSVKDNHLCLTQQGLLLYNSICENISIL
jgi:oxygen-independent coproporphyrinogen-3 oxidase